MQSNERHRNGFTLIELLIVVAVLLALVAILLPALETARLSAKASACASNERQQVMAYRMWATDHNNQCYRPMVTNYGSPDGNFYTQMMKYLGPNSTSLSGVWADPGADDPPLNANSLHYGISALAPSIWLREENDGAGVNIGVITGKSSLGYQLPPTTMWLPSYNQYWMYPHPVSLDELPYPSSTGVFACKLISFWPSGGLESSLPVSGMGLAGISYWPWPLHGTGRMTVNGRVNFARLDGSVRNYPFQEVVYANAVGYQGTVPAAFASGLRPLQLTPRYYLWSGQAPNNTNRTGGWLTE